MTEHARDAEAIFYAALDKTTPEGRVAYVEATCVGEPELLQRVRELLGCHEGSQGLLDAPPPGLGCTVDLSEGSEQPGTVIGPYKLLQQIGEGGMGNVYMAEQSRPVQRKVALKVIKPGMDTRQVIARFEAERQALAMMDHVNIARVLDAGATESGRPYFVMELINGVPITRYCDSNRLTPRERLELFVPVCQAIQHAHQKGIIHRDIKPSNVMITLYDGEPVPKVIDFGVAKATEQRLTERTLFTQYGTMVGTLEYMSPEQAEFSALGVDTRSDIFSLGVLLFELLTGSTPLSRKRLTGARYDEILRMIREEEAPRPSTRLSDSGEALASISTQRQMEPAKLTRLVRGELDWIVMKTLEKDRNRRYETASGLAMDVRRYLNDEPVQACPASTWYRFRKFARRNRRAVVTASAAALVIVLAVAGLATSTLLIARGQQATQNALQAETRAKDDLEKGLERERHESYFHRIALAHRELSADNLGRALQFLGECPEDLRGWEWHYLMRFCRVDPLILRDTTGVNSVAFSPDGEYLASAVGDGAVKVWNSRTGKLIQTIENAHRGFVCSVAFHPHGKHLASVGADKLMRVWEWTTGHKVFERPCDAVPQVGTAYGVAFSPLDPNHLAVGFDGTVTIWDWKNEKSVHIFPGHFTNRISVAFSRDGRQLATGDWGGRVKLWDAVSGGGPLYFPESGEPPQPACALAFSQDGEQLATANFGRRVDVWGTRTGRRLHTIPHDGTLVMCVAYSPKGRYIVSAGEDKTVRVWDATTGRELLALRGHTGICGCVTFSPDGQRLASASMDGSIRIWDATPLEGYERQETASVADSNEVWSVAVSPGGQRIISAGWSMPATVRNANTRQVSARFIAHSGVCFCVAWQPDGQRIASAGWDDGLFTVKVWNAHGREEFPLKGALLGGPEFYAVAFSCDGQHLVTGNAKGAVQVWDSRTGDQIRTLGTHKVAVRGVVFSPDHRHLASVSTDGEVKLWDASRLGVDLNAELEPRRTPLAAHVPGACLNVAFSPDGKRIAMGGEESTVKICDVASGEVLHTLRGHSRDVYTVAFSPDDGRWVASAGEDSTVKIWDSRTGKLIRTFRGHTGLVSSLAFIDGRTLISGSRDRTVKFWDLTPLEVVPER